MRYFTLLAGLFLFFSCGNESESEEKVALEEVGTEDVIEEEVMEVEVFSEEEKRQQKMAYSDSLSEVYELLRNSYISMRPDYDNMKGNYRTFVLTEFDVYSHESHNWFFNDAYELQYYERDLGVEGGYMEYELWFFEEGQLSFVHTHEMEEMDFSVYSYEKYNITDGTLSAVTNDPRGHEFSKFFIPDFSERNNAYEDLISKISKDDYTYEKTFNFEDSKEVESEYGGTESAGYSITIDSLLFGFLYP